MKKFTFAAVRDTLDTNISNWIVEIRDVPGNKAEVEYINITREQLPDEYRSDFIELRTSDIRNSFNVLSSEGRLKCASTMEQNGIDHACGACMNRILAHAIFSQTEFATPLPTHRPKLSA